MIRMTLRRYSGAWNSIFCCSDQRHVVRPEQPFTATGNSTPAHGFDRQQLLAHGHVQHAPQAPEIPDAPLSAFSIPCSMTPAAVLTRTRCLEPPSQIQLRCRPRSDVRQFASSERCSQMSSSPRSFASWVFSARMGGLEIVLQEKIRPFVEN